MIARRIVQCILTVCPHYLEHGLIGQPEVAKNSGSRLCRQLSKWQVVKRLKQLLINRPDFALVRTTSQYTFETDAFDKQIGCVRLRKQPDGPERLIRYWSGTMIDKEEELATMHRTCLEVNTSVLLVRLYLEDSQFIFPKNHDAVKWLLPTSDASGKLGC